MTKWGKDTTKFTTKITYDKLNRGKTTIPRPLVDLFGKPDSVTFAFINGDIMAFFTREKKPVS